MANNQVTQSNFAGTKTWKGGSSAISNYAGSEKENGYATGSPTGGKNKAGRHPEGVKGGNSQMPSGKY